MAAGRLRRRGSQGTLVKAPIGRAGGGRSNDSAGGCLVGIRQTELAEDSPPQYHVRNLMVQLCRQHSAGYFDLGWRYLQLPQERCQSLNVLRFAQFNRSDSIFVTAEAD